MIYGIRCFISRTRLDVNRGTFLTILRIPPEKPGLKVAGEFVIMPITQGAIAQTAERGTHKP